jgi:hypothetical protein
MGLEHTHPSPPAGGPHAAGIVSELQQTLAAKWRARRATRAPMVGHAGKRVEPRMPEVNKPVERVERNHTNG